MAEAAIAKPVPSAESAKGEMHIRLFANRIMVDFKGDIKGRDIDIIIHQLVKQYRMWKMRLSKEAK